MASTKNMQQEAMASIDTAKAMIDKVLSIMEIILVSPSLSITFATNPIGFLLQLLKHLGVTYEELRQWLTNFLIFVVPVLEISVKTILLTNLKSMISCSVDPRIPEKYRKRHKGGNTNTSQEYGIDINIESIDFMNKLSTSPLTDVGSELYFGLEGVDDVYKFARAFDFDAFLWFVMHKGKFPNSQVLDGNKNLGDPENLNATIKEGDSLLGVVEFSRDSSSTVSTLLGNTFTYNGDAHILSMCIDRQYGDSNNVIKNTLVPVSDDWNSVNWYARSGSYFTSNLGLAKQKNEGRDYSKEKGLCNLQFIDQASSTSPITGLVNNKLRFTILPKPYIHIPNINGGEAPWNYKKMLFNAKGEYDSNGKYTFGSVPSITESGGETTYNIGEASVTVKGNKVDVSDTTKLIKNLMECYPGLTVYEFNYDYIMSLKLFDAKVMATTLLDSLINTRVGVNLSFASKSEESSESIKEIIKNIIESDDSSVNDCYYTFDNSKYDAMLKKSEAKRSRKEEFGKTSRSVGNFSEVNEILSEYDSTADLNVQIDVLKRAITQASVTVSEGFDAKDRFSIEYNFVYDLIENLITAIINGILSPKVLLLLEVNQTIMGGTWEKFTLKDLLMAMQSIIVALIKEVRDLVIQELLKFLLKQLEPIIEMLASILLREQLEAYADAIIEIIRNCPFIWFSFGNKNLDTKLDTVDYADIDVSSTKEGEQPNNNC